MVIVLVHLLCLLGKYVYNSYRIKRLKALCEAARHDKSQTIYEMLEEIYEDRPLSSSTELIRFSPPAYIQRYNAVIEVLYDPKYKEQLRKVVDFGCSELGFVTFLKNVDGIEEILCVDIDRELLEDNKYKAQPLTVEYLRRRKTPLTIEICEGSVTHPDQKLQKTDAVICIELIEHLYPDTLRDFPANIFGYIMPKVAIVTTPNADFNVLFPNFSGFRHPDHKFEWTRSQFEDWAREIVARYPCYSVTFHGICYGPAGTEEVGACTQMAVFHKASSTEECRAAGVEGLFKTVETYEYPVERDIRSDEQKIQDEATYYINFLLYEDPGNPLDEVSLEKVLPFLMNKFTISLETLRTVLEDGGSLIVDRENGPVVVNTTYLSEETSEFDMDEADLDLERDDDDEEWNDTYEPGYGSTVYEIPVPEAPSTEEPPQNYSYTENWDVESSVVIAENRSVDQEHTYLFDGENWDGTSERPNATYSRLDVRDTTTSKSGDDDRLEVSSRDDEIESGAVRRVGSPLNFRPPLSVSRSSTSPEALLASGWGDCPLNYSANEFYGNSSLLNNTFCRSEVPNDAGSAEFAGGGARDTEERLSGKARGSGDAVDIARVSGFAGRPKFTSSPYAKESASSDAEQRRVRKRRSLMSSMSGAPLRTDETIGEAESDTDVADVVSQIANAIEATTRCVISSSDDPTVSERDTDARTQPRVETEDHVTGRCIEKRGVTEREADAASDARTTESRPTSSLGSGNVAHKGGACCTAATDDGRGKARTENTGSGAIGVTRSSSSARSPPGELSSFSARNDDESSKCAKGTAGNGGCCASNDDARNVQQPALPGIAQVGTSRDTSVPAGSAADNVEAAKPSSPPETPPDSWSPEIMDSGYPNSASAQDITPEYDLSSIAQDHVPDSESPSVAEAPRLVVEPVEVENGDLANNNRDDEGNNMVAADVDIENLQPLIDVLENDLENENDIYVMRENGFPMWLLRILDMANPADFDAQARQRLRAPDDVADAAGYAGHDDEGFDSSSENESDVAYNEMENDNEHDK